MFHNNMRTSRPSSGTNEKATHIVGCTAGFPVVVDATKRMRKACYKDLVSDSDEPTMIGQRMIVNRK